MKTSWGKVLAVLMLLAVSCGKDSKNPTGLDNEDGPSQVVLPVQDYFESVSQGFAEYLSSYGGKVYNGYHAGEDIGVIVGTPVYSIAEGRVVRISQLTGLGYLIALEHEGSFNIPARTEMVNGQQYAYTEDKNAKNIYSVYIHVVPTPSLKVNQSVMKGEQIATIAQTTLSPHLHFEIRLPLSEPSSNWTLVGDQSNWSVFPDTGTPNGYYVNPQKMVDAGLRHPSDFLTSNLVEAYTVSGRVLENGSGLPGTTVSITGTDVNASTITNNNGEYSFTGIPNGTYTLTASKTEYLFSPPSVTVTVNNTNASAQDILASHSIIPPTHNIHEITFVTIPGGTFQMGDVENVTYSSDEKPVHTVTVTGFEMSVYEITNAQYAKFLNEAIASGDITSTSTYVKGAMGVYSGRVYLSLQESSWLNNKCWITYSSDTSTFTVVSDKENWPVVYITWYGAKAFALYYGLDLPTEAEWEYACRGGRQYMYGTDDGTIDGLKANYSQIVNHPAVVGSYPANPFGLYDMSGNVEEWCHDGKEPYRSGGQTNPIGLQTNFCRVSRGGGWYFSDWQCRSAYRKSYFEWFRDHDLGFRVVRRASPQNY